MHFLKALVPSILAITSLYVVSVQAQENNQSEQKAIAACNDKEIGDLCSFTNDNGDNVNGACQSGGSNGEGKPICIAYH